MSKIKINMLSKADTKPAQGVASAYLEQVKLIKEGAKDLFDVVVNDKKDADIMHYHTVNFNFFLRMKLTKKTNVCYVHFLPETLDGSIKLPKFIFKLFKKYVLSFYRSANFLIVVNPIFIEPLVKYGIDREKIFYIPNYVSKKDFFPKNNIEINQIKKDIKIFQNSFVVLGVGQVQTRKGIIDFIEVAKKMSNVTFVWCGGFSFGKITDGYKELKKIYENPPKNVKFLGIIPREKMNDIYNIADVLFMPSYNELFPMAILEAVNVNKPLLLRDLDLYKDILFNKYLKGNDNKEFIDLLTKIKKDKNLYQKCCEDSKYISDFYSKDNVLKLWKEFYIKIYNSKQ